MPGYPEIGDQFGHYVVRRRIGRGGMGTVFEAEQQGTGRRVALKVLSPELSDEEAFRDRFSQEAATLLALDSPHVIALYDYGDQDGALFIATQLVPGRDLSQLLEDGGALDCDQALEIVAQVADALADAHESGLIHRDVKPSNVLVRYIRGEPFVYLCDFGIAKPEQSVHTRTRGVIGTVEYMAPERHLGGDADRRSDVYSLGCVLWAAVSGSAPYKGTSEVQVAMAHLQQPVPVVDTTIPHAAVLQQIISTAMAKDPADRYQTAEQLGAAVRHAQQRAHHAPQQPGDSLSIPVRSRTVLRGDMSRVDIVAPPRKSEQRAPGRLAAVLVAIPVLGLAALGVWLVGQHDNPPVARADIPSGATVAEPVAASEAAAQDSTPPTGTASATLTCWDGDGVMRVADCLTPTGRLGMASVFPFFEACRTATPNIRGKLEVFECPGDRFLVRYSRWAPAADRFAYLNESNTPAQLAPWVLSGEPAGTTWTSYETPQQDPRENMRYQWSATYATSPFQVSVEGVTPADRAAGVARVQATPASRVGLR